MADKPTVPSFTGNSTFKASKANELADDLATAIEGCLGRGGTGESPNSMTGNLDMDLNKIQNLGTPTVDNDAVTKKYLDDNYSEAATTAAGVYAAAAAASATAAETAETNAETAETNAETAETNAATSETNAAASEAKAEDWAIELEDVEVETGKYSALHWAAKAEGFLTDATTTQKGLVELATDAESLAESDTARTVTPSNLGAVLSPLRAFFDKHHTGLAMSNGTDASHDIDIVSGTCRDSGNDYFFSTTGITKQIDAAWTAGTNVGGFPSGISLAVDTWYRVFLIYDVTNGLTDAGFDTSATAATLLADTTDYTKYRQIGWVLTDGSSDIRKFWQSGGDKVVWDMAAKDRALASTGLTTGVLQTLTVPPGTVADIALHNYMGQMTVTSYVHVSETRQTDSAPDDTTARYVMTSGAAEHPRESVRLEVLADSSSQIRLRTSNANHEMCVRTSGYTFLWD
jgi:hypothetical protein